MKVDVNENALRGISEYCKGRHYKCRTCRFSIHKYTDADERGHATCIFENCPCDWKVMKK